MIPPSGPARRKAIELPLEIFVQDDEPPVLGVTVNVSESGMLVLSEEPAPRNSEIRFRFTRFQGRGRVIWAHAGERGSMFLGVRFTDLDDEAEFQLESILESAEREYRPAGPRVRLRS